LGRDDEGIYRFTHNQPGGVVLRSYPNIRLDGIAAVDALATDTNDIGCWYNRWRGLEGQGAFVIVLFAAFLRVIVCFLEAAVYFVFRLL
jgi:hypothetical protein